MLVALNLLKMMSLFSLNGFSCYWQISRLIYTYSGTGILALLSNGVHLLWKWQRRESNISGRVCDKVYLFESVSIMQF